MENNNEPNLNLEPQNQPEPPQHCVRCGAVLQGPFCGSCGLPRGAAPPPPPPPSPPSPPRYTAYYPPYPTAPPRGQSGKIVLIIVIIVLSVMLFFGSCAAVIVFADRAGTYSSSEDSLIPDFPYDGYDDYDDYYDDYYDYGYEYGYGYSNETPYIRVDALNTTRSAGTVAFPAPEGKEYLIANVRLTNLDTDFYPYDTVDFELLLNTSGNLLPALFTDIDSSTALGNGRLVPSGHVEGTVVFLVPKGELNLVLYMSDYEGMINFPLL